MENDFKIERITENMIEPGDKLVLKIPRNNLPRAKSIKYAKGVMNQVKGFLPDIEILVLIDGIDIEILKQEKKDV